MNDHVGVVANDVLCRVDKTWPDITELEREGVTVEKNNPGDMAAMSPATLLHEGKMCA